MFGRKEREYASCGFMDFEALADFAEELSFDELLSVNGGCGGGCGGGSYSSSYTPSITSSGGSSTSSSSSGVTCSNGIIYSSNLGCGGSLTAGLKKSIAKYQNDPYIFGKYDCDIWVEKVLKENGVDISVWGSASSNDVAAHEKNLNGKTTDTPTGTWNVVLMTDSDVFTVNHALLMESHSDGSVTVYQHSRDTSANVSSGETYSSVQAFQNAYAYNDFDYLKIQ